MKSKIRKLNVNAYHKVLIQNNNYVVETILSICSWSGNCNSVKFYFFGRCIISVIQTIKYNYFVCNFCPGSLNFQYYTYIHCGTNSPLIYSVEFGNRMPHFFFSACLNITLEQFRRGKRGGGGKSRVKSIAVKKQLSLNYFLFWDRDWCSKFSVLFQWATCKYYARF